MQRTLPSLIPIFNNKDKNYPRKNLLRSCPAWGATMFWFPWKNMPTATYISTVSRPSQRRKIFGILGSLTLKVSIRMSKHARTPWLGRSTFKKMEIGWNIQHNNPSLMFVKDSITNSGLVTVLRRKFNPGIAKRFGNCATSQERIPFTKDPQGE